MITYAGRVALPPGNSLLHTYSTVHLGNMIRASLLTVSSTLTPLQPIHTGSQECLNDFQFVHNNISRVQQKQMYFFVFLLLLFMFFRINFNTDQSYIQHVIVCSNNNTEHNECVLVFEVNVFL